MMNPISASRNYLKYFIVLTLLISSLRITMLFLQVWPLNGDEAQYWSWGKHLAWGYYSKPPMVAWLIALSTWLFGDGIAAMRLMSPLAHSITAVMIYLSARKLFSERTGFWAGIAYLLLPGVTFSATIISTDPPLLMFWSMAFYCFINALENNRYRDWIAMGAALGLAMLSKYAALFFLISMFFYLLMAKKQRHFLKKPGLYLAILVSAIILMPNIAWNYQHAFVSISAVKANAALNSQLFHPMNMLAFLGAQFALFGPVLFAVLLGLLCKPDIWRQQRYLLLISFTLPLLFIMTLEGLLVRAHGNWAAPAYITAAILVTAFLLNTRRIYWLIIALSLHTLIFISFIWLQPIVRVLRIPMHPSTTVINWSQQNPVIKAYQQRYPEAYILVDDRMLLTEIMYFGAIPLDKVFKWNPQGLVRDHYDLVTHLGNKTGKDFLLFTYNPEPGAILQRFHQAKPLPALKLKSLDGRSLTVYVYYLTGFKGYA